MKNIGNHFRLGELDAVLHDTLESAKNFLYYEKIGFKFKNLKTKLDFKILYKVR
ncbi:TPA: hypothetical protein ACTOAE_000180 [Campylobacter jejuni]